MAEDRQNIGVAVREKRGVPIYATNPSIPHSDSISKRRKSRIGNDQKGLVIDGIGEVLGQGAAVFYEMEEVDNTRFVKMFLEGIKQVVGLSKTGLSVFELVYLQMQERHNHDTVGLSYDLAKTLIKDMTERTYSRGLKELLDREILFKSLIDGVFFVNIRYMFNGDRLAFVKGYKRKMDKTKQVQQAE